jgi:quinol monooxygenase YgiN
VACLSLKLSAPAGHAREITGALHAIVRRARHAHKCVLASLYQSVEDQNQLLLQSEWADAEQLTRYVRSDDFAQVLTLIEMAVEPPVVEVRLTGETRGLDYIAEARGAQRTAH